MLDVVHLDTVWLQDALAVQALHEAPNLATVALLAAVLPLYLDARRLREFRQTMKQRYRAFTQPGTPDGPP